MFPWACARSRLSNSVTKCEASATNVGSLARSASTGNRVLDSCNVSLKHQQWVYLAINWPIPAVECVCLWNIKQWPQNPTTQLLFMYFEAPLTNRVSSYLLQICIYQPNWFYVKSIFYCKRYFAIVICQPRGWACSTLKTRHWHVKPQ